MRFDTRFLATTVATALLLSPTLAVQCYAQSSPSPTLEKLKSARTTDDLFGKSNSSGNIGGTGGAPAVRASGPVQTSSGTYTVNKSSAPVTGAKTEKAPKTKKEPEHTGSPH